MNLRNCVCPLLNYKMLRTLSYLNLVLAVVYFLGWLQNGSGWIIAGLLFTVVFNWLVLRNIEQASFGWSFPQWFTAVLTLLFAFFTGYSAILLSLSTIEYSNYQWDTLLLIFLGFLFSCTLLSHLFLSRPKIS